MRVVRMWVGVVVVCLLAVAGMQAQSTIKGSGTTNFVAKFTAATKIGNSSIFDNGANVGIGTASPLARLHIAGNVLASGSVTGSSFSGNGAGLTGVDAATVGGLTPAAFAQLAAVSNNFSGSISATSVVTPSVQAAGGPGGGLALFANDSPPDSGSGGNIDITAGGSTDTTGGVGPALAGNVTISGGTSRDNNVGGQVLIQAGTSRDGFVGAPGSVLVTGPHGFNGTAGGSVFLTAGGNLSCSGPGATVVVAGFGAGDTGDITLQPIVHPICSPGGSRILLAPSGGNVGIGTPAPSATLEVVAGGTTLADDWTVRSSARWKTNIHPLEGALTKVEQLRGVSYDRKSDGKAEIGVIAEEVGAVVPEVVSYEKNGTEAQGVDYARLTALLIEAVKEQQAQIRELKSEVERLKQQRASVASR